MLSSITVTKKAVIDDEVMAAGLCLRRAFDTPTIEELRAYAAASRRTDLEILLLTDGRQPVALSICHVGRDQVHGLALRTYRLLGYQLYDYNELYWANGYGDSLIRAMREDAAALGCDAVLLDNLSARVPELRGAGGEIVEELRIARLGTDGDPTLIAGKRSFKRDAAFFRKQAGYRVVHRHGDFTEEDIRPLARLHVERWAFDGVTSQFSANPCRAAEYHAYPRNKLLTSIFLGDELVAGHFGMVFGNTLIFHTPVVNVRYLQASPMKLLLLEMSRWCMDNGVTTLDFGLGDEDYKLGVTNAARSAYSYLVPVTLRGRLALTVRHAMRSGWKKRVQALTALARGLRLHMPSQAESVFFRMEGNVPSPGPGLELLSVREYPELIDLLRAHGVAPRRRHLDCLRQGLLWIGLQHDGRLVSSAWLALPEAVPNDDVVSRSSPACIFDPDLAQDRQGLVSLALLASSAFPGLLLRTDSMPEGRMIGATLNAAGFVKVSRRTRAAAGLPLATAANQTSAGSADA